MPRNAIRKGIKNSMNKVNKNNNEGSIYKNASAAASISTRQKRRQDE